MLNKAWDESEHPREPAGSPSGGQFTSGGGGLPEGVTAISLDDLSSGDQTLEEALEQDRYGLSQSQVSDMMDWLSDNPESLRADKSFGKVLQKFPVVQGKVWRGMVLNDEDLAKLKVGATYEINKWSSSSTRKDVGIDFSQPRSPKRPNSVLLEIDDRAFKIPSQYTSMAGTVDEDEVVLMMGDKYKITGVNNFSPPGYSSRTYTLVRMTHVK